MLWGIGFSNSISNWRVWLSNWRGVPLSPTKYFEVRLAGPTPHNSIHLLIITTDFVAFY